MARTGRKGNQSSLELAALSLKRVRLCHPERSKPRFSRLAESKDPYGSSEFRHVLPTHYGPLDRFQSRRVQRCPISAVVSRCGLQESRNTNAELP
jgi:hypothetical protein